MKAWLLHHKQYKLTILTLLAFFLGYQLTYVSYIEAQLQSIRTIMNDVWDAANHRMMISTWAGAQGALQTEQTIWNDVWNKPGHYIQTSGGGGGAGTSDPVTLQLTDQATIGINSDNCTLCYLNTLSQNTTFTNPTGTPGNGRLLLIEIVSASIRTLTWDTNFAAPTNLPLPTATTGGGKADVFGYRYNTTTSKWDFWSTTQTPKAAITRTCMLNFGSENAAAVLTNADLGPQRFGCVVPYAATVTEVTVYADGGTPNIIVHRRSGVTNTALLSSALATAASGALACSRPTAVAGYAGTVCSATLQNTAIGAGDTIGATSGTAGGVAKMMSIAVHYEFAN